MLSSDDFYVDREQSWVKHQILRMYLERLTHIIGFSWPSITYVDGFSGPWNERSERFEDTSFGIAIQELRRAKVTHPNFRLRCVFVEKDRQAFQKLEQFCASIQNVEIRLENRTFEAAIPEIVRFVRADPGTFTFTLIDPKGPSGFAMKRIAPLLRIAPGEVLINFMLEFIRRSISFDDVKQCYRDLFGTDDYTESLRGLQGSDRDDAIAEKYCGGLREECGYEFVQRASILHPDKNGVNYLLVYGTRHNKGVDVFKKAEEKAMLQQEKKRAEVERRRDEKTGERFLFEADEQPESSYYNSLRNRYLNQAKQAIVQMLQGGQTVNYDLLWANALSYPMVWESDLRDWLRAWRDAKTVQWNGLSPKGRELRVGCRHSVELTTGRLE